MAEAGVSESTMLALMGHMSRAMLERYSHIFVAAKQAAIQSLEANEFERERCAIGQGSCPSLTPTLMIVKSL